jgi:hypothetical protein
MRTIKLVVLGLALATLSSCNTIGDDVCNTSEFEVVNIIPIRSKDNYPRPTTTTYNITVWDDCLQKNIVYITPYVSRLGFTIGDTVYNTKLKGFYKQTK